MTFPLFRLPRVSGMLLAWIVGCAVAAVLQAVTPPGWSSITIGSPSVVGSVVYTEATGQTAITGPGHMIERNSDNFQFVYKPLAGDGEIVARVVGQTNPASYPHAGIMLRSALTANSANWEIYATRDSGVSFQARATNGASTAGSSRNGALGAPVWLKLARLGSRVTPYTSANGVLWTKLDGVAGLTLPETVYVGMSAGSTQSGGGAISTYDKFEVKPVGSAPTDATVSVLGRAVAVGTASTDAEADAYTLAGNGANIGGVAPDFLFLQKPMAQDGEIRVRIASLSIMGPNTNAGIMIRDSLEPGAVYFSITASTGGLRQQHIKNTGHNPTSATRPMPSLPVWLRIVRKGPLFTASSSPDGITWEPLGGTVALPMQSDALVGLTLVAGGGDDPFAKATFDNVTWPQPAAPLAEIDPVVAAGLVAWRKPDVNNIRCVDCHTPMGYDIAQFNFTRDDLRLATTPHLPQSDADAIFDMLEKLRVQYPPAGGLKNFRTFRPLQPGGGHIVGGENASANERDAAFGFYLRDHFAFAQDRIVTLAQARAAAQELIDVKTADVPVGIKFNLWSRSVLREGAVVGGEIAEWLPSVGIQPKPEYTDYWFALQDAYLRDPSNENFWTLYHATGLWTQLDTHNFVVGSTHGNWRYVVISQYLANALFSHDELLKARGLPSLLDAEDGVRPFRDQRGISDTELAPFWNVGDNARVVQNRGFDGMPVRNKESVHLDRSYNGNLAEVSGWKIDNLRLTWFWIGWNMDNSLRFSGEGSTLSGEYFIGSLWQGNVDNQRTGDSDSSHGYRMHQVFFNAVHQFKLGFQSGAWRDNDGVQHFEASKGYYLGYDRWRPRSQYQGADVGLPGANALYKRVLSNHIRMAMLVHADEARKTDGNYYNENFTRYDLALWRDLLAWADPEWKQADEALLSDLKASLTPPLAAIDTGDMDGNGQPDLLDDALLPVSAPPEAPVVPARVERTPEGVMTITFMRGRDNFTYVVESSTDLINWSVVSTNAGVVGETVTVPDPASSGKPRYFLRLRVINTRA
ncbi:MAG: hypothetical protein H7067_02930 [Burkholderiales bacterium]|nr:hypothetical protein [Opitutaceae bacterium]